MFKQTTKDTYMATLFKKLLLIAALMQSTQATPKNVYDKLASLHLPSLAIELHAEQKKLTEIQDENKKIEKQQSPSKWNTIKTQELLPGEALQIAYNVLQTTNQEANTTPDADAHKTNQLKHRVCKDLTMFYSGDSDNPKNHLFNHLDYTETIVGKIILQKMLYEPTTDVSILQKRQQIIRALLTDETLFNEINEHVKTIKALEPEMLWFFKKQDDTIADYYKLPYFAAEKFNSNANALELNYHKNTSIGKTIAIISPLLLPVATSWVAQKMCAKFLTELNPTYVPPSFFETAKTHYKGRFEAMFKDQVTLDFGILGNKTIKISKTMRAASVALTCWELYSWYKGIKTCYDIAKSHTKVTHDIHTKTVKTAKFFDTIKALDQKIQEHKELAEHISSPIFTNNQHAVGSPGTTLRTFHELQKDHVTIINFMKFAGQIDAYLSITKYCKTLHDNQFCFASYVKNDTPHLEIANLWHPMLDADNAVTNNILLSGNAETTQNMIITGPNAGGKSTFLREVIIAVIMAQTFGIAPAQQMTISPFALIDTYINITDTIGNQSLFQAEADRTAEMLRSVQMLEEHNKQQDLQEKSFSLVIFDEIYTGTDDETAIKEAKTDIAYLYSMPHNIAIIATHHHELARYFETHKHTYRVTNQKVTVTEQQGTDGEPEYTSTYKLEPGISNQKIGSSVCRDARKKHHLI